LLLLRNDCQKSGGVGVRDLERLDLGGRCRRQAYSGRMELLVQKTPTAKLEILVHHGAGGTGR